MKRPALAIFGAWVSIFGALSGSASAQDAGKPGPDKSAIETKPIGKVFEVKGEVSLEHTTSVLLQANLPQGGPSQAKENDLIYQGDLVQTGVDSSARISFVDGTSFNISSNARMEMDEFIYDPKGKSNSSLINLTRGTFTFVAGAVAKTGNMRVETPVATMGIRGTAPRVDIMDDGSVKFSTLIEEHKSAKDQSKRPAVTRQDHAGATSGTKLDLPAIEEKKVHLQICKGC